MTIELTHPKQLPGDAGGGPVGLGIDKGCALLWYHLLVI